MVAATTHDGLAAPNRVPRITADFWLVKILAITVGETVSACLTVNLGLGLSATAWIMSTLLIMALILQFHQRRYVPWIYWMAVMLLAIVAMLVNDDLVDNLGAPLETTTAFFAIALVMAFALWSLWEESMSIRMIITARREVFYWLTLFFTFALGTAMGDLIAEYFPVSHLASTGFYALLAGLLFLAYRLKLDGTFCFWMACIVTRPLGAALGDLVSQPRDTGGLGLGVTLTSLLFLAAIIATVIHMTRSHDGENYAMETH